MAYPDPQHRVADELSAVTSPNSLPDLSSGDNGSIHSSTQCYTCKVSALPQPTSRPHHDCANCRILSLCANLNALVAYGACNTSVGAKLIAGTGAQLVRLAREIRGRGSSPWRGLKDRRIGGLGPEMFSCLTCGSENGAEEEEEEDRERGRAEKEPNVQSIDPAEPRLTFRPSELLGQHRPFVHEARSLGTVDDDPASCPPHLY